MKICKWCQIFNFNYFIAKLSQYLYQQEFFMGKHSQQIIDVSWQVSDEVKVNNQCHRYKQVCNVHGSPMLNL